MKQRKDPPKTNFCEISFLWGGGGWVLEFVQKFIHIPRFLFKTLAQMTDSLRRILLLKRLVIMTETDSLWKVRNEA